MDSNSSISDAVDKTINAYKSHPGILLIKKKKKENVGHCSLKEVSVSELEKQLRNLNSNKATTLVIY